MQNKIQIIFGYDSGLPSHKMTESEKIHQVHIFCQNKPYLDSICAKNNLLMGNYH